MTGRRISRRHAIVVGGLGTAALAVGVTGWLTATGGGAADSRLQPRASGAALQQPRLLDSRNGHLEVTLTAAPGARLAGQDTRALSYNGTSPGPTLRVRPGDQLAVRLINQLDQPTNLHTHGLRVSPRGNSDNPFIRVDPGASADYLFRIPPDHPTGTYWYHPHHHGTVADQVFGGLCGALLVDGGPDLAVTVDRVLLVTDTTLDGDGQVTPVGPMEQMMGRRGELVLVNGQHRPTIPATPGAMQRWRIVNGCTSRVLPIRLADHELVEIAQDGTFLPAPRPEDRVVLAPGNRADVVVRPRATGRYELTAEAVASGAMPGMGGDAATSGAVTLAVMAAAGAGAPAPPLPTTLPAEPQLATPATTRRRIDFRMGTGTGGMAFTIDGRSFDPERIDQTVALGTTEEWTVTNSSPLAHPFHLHVWPFTVLATSDATPLTGTPQDVVLIPARGWVRLRIPFTRHPGRSVYHCHILDHEDLGMMATVNVVG